MISDFTAQALLTEARYLDTKPAEAHNMRAFVCGSISCAIGDMMLQQGLFPKREADVMRVFEVMEYDLPMSEVGKDIIWPDGNFEYIAAELGMSFEEACFLFDIEHTVQSSSSWVDGRSIFHVRDRYHEGPKETAARLRKYVYYKLRKREIFRDYERARRQEGDWNVAQHVKECLVS